MKIATANSQDVIVLVLDRDTASRLFDLLGKDEEDWSGDVWTAIGRELDSPRVDA